MIVEKTKLEGVLIITPKVFSDNRGWFAETYSYEKINELKDINFVQDNQSYSQYKNTFRGLHFQNHPYAQSKLVRCIKGKIVDFAVDLRKDSKTYKEYISVELSAENKKMLFIPKGFAHGFLTLENDSEVAYKVDDFYAPKCDKNLLFNDSEINLSLPKDLILSDKDSKAPYLKELKSNFSTKILITGANGQLGMDLVKLLLRKKINHLGTDINDLDITNREKTLEYINNYKPDIIIHGAAYTAVDKAEDEKDLCFAVNVTGTQNIVEAAKKINAKLIFVSTDYVFDKKDELPILENEKTSPLNYYGFTKNEAEKLVMEYEKIFIVRTSWVFGKFGNNFLKTILKLAREKDFLKIVNDQIGSPTFTPDLSRALVELAFTNDFGIYHITNEGFCSWSEFAEFALREVDIKTNVKGIPSLEYPTKAKRPFNSRLAKDNLDKIGIKRLPHWQDAVKRYLKEIKE